MLHSQSLTCQRLGKCEGAVRILCCTLGWRDFWEKKTGTRQVVQNSLGPQLQNFAVKLCAGPRKILTLTIKWAKHFFTLFNPAPGGMSSLLEAKNEEKKKFTFFMKFQKNVHSKMQYIVKILRNKLSAYFLRTQFFQVIPSVFIYAHIWKFHKHPRLNSA